MEVKRLSLSGINYSVVDYNNACNLIIINGINFNSYGVSALAVH